MVMAVEEMAVGGVAQEMGSGVGGELSGEVAVKFQVVLSAMPGNGFPERSATAVAEICSAYDFPGIRSAVGLMVRAEPDTETWAESVTEMTRSDESVRLRRVRLPVPMATDSLKVAVRLPSAETLAALSKGWVLKSAGVEVSGPVVPSRSTMARAIESPTSM